MSDEPRGTSEISDADLADDFRTQSFHLIEAHPIAAAHLVLAAASIAPECDAEKDLADEFSYLIVDFAQELRILHARAIARRAQSVGRPINGH
ncbi:hypothetical protein [Sphingomonas xinjiangensis]|uniref:Uncharacterized protein n=1 Tax=Sphingomonas xinjiangensis TaxID=643568 RepID=A0A840YTT1_9SPHN|nr:hypothetical protein [Sphingomonas xinjiangensis]MBB5713052.1 hypothetical protein [Sphingomonas xinjiangensis]